MSALPRVHGDRLALGAALDFATNIWPGERPAGLDEAMAGALSGRAYPDEGPARRAVAARHGRDASEVLLLNGACEAFWLLAHALQPAVAACIHPSFTEPELALRATGCRVVRVQRESAAWTFDPTAVPDEADLVVVGNPNNPTGGLDDPARILGLRRPGRLVVVDESFMDLAVDQSASLARSDDLVVVRSLTKRYAIPGVRAGYLLGPRALVARLEGQRQPWSVNAIALAAVAFCAAEDDGGAAATAVAAARSGLFAALRSLPGVNAWPGAANFLLLRLDDAPAVAERLRARGIAVRTTDDFPGLGEDFLRVAVRTPSDNDRLVEAVQACR